MHSVTSRVPVPEPSFFRCPILRGWINFLGGDVFFRLTFSSIVRFGFYSLASGFSFFFFFFLLPDPASRPGPGKNTRIDGRTPLVKNLTQPPFSTLSLPRHCFLFAAGFQPVGPLPYWFARNDGVSLFLSSWFFFPLLSYSPSITGAPNPIPCSPPLQTPCGVRGPGPLSGEIVLADWIPTRHALQAVPRVFWTPFPLF